MLLFAQKRVHYLHEVEEVMYWIHEKVRRINIVIQFAFSVLAQDVLPCSKIFFSE